MSQDDDKKTRIISDDLLDDLSKLPDLFYGEDMDNLSKAKLKVVLEALDDAADFINDYLTENHFSITHHYPDFVDKKIQ